MASCCLCRKSLAFKNNSFFNIPKEKSRRNKWSEICGIQLPANAPICVDHFSPKDIINDSLAPDAEPCNLFKLENFSVTDIKCKSSFVHIGTNYKKIDQKCRCCTKPSENFTQLEICITISEGIEKSYKEMLYEITNFPISLYQENSLPQEICWKCIIQLKNSYQFIQQACKVSRQYIDMIGTVKSRKEIKNIEQLQEPLIEISEVPIVVQGQEELKVEPLDIICNMDIKEEKLESKLFMPAVENNNESQEDMRLPQNSNTDDPSSSEDDSDEPKPLNNVRDDLNNKSLARSCDICQKVYRNEHLLKIHKHYTHMAEEDKLPCPLCSYKARRPSDLKVHMGLLHGQDKVNQYFKPALDSSKKFPCNLCSRTYKRKDSLRLHVKSKHLNKPSKEKNTETAKPKQKERFLCSYCGQSFSSKACLEGHVFTHTGERPFSCEICSKTFKRLKDLQLHRVIHSDEKPHQCSQCDKAFKRVDKLQIHMRVHSELRPYKCSECEKTFKYPNVLRTHMHIHTGQTPFECKTCGDAFSLRTSLNNHCLKNGHEK